LDRKRISAGFSDFFRQSINSFFSSRSQNNSGAALGQGESRFTSDSGRGACNQRYSFFPIHVLRL
jgi:hypothetical protein